MSSSGESSDLTGGGPNGRPLDDTVAQSGPGIPDDAASPGYDPVADAEAEHELEARPPSPETLFKDRPG